MNKPGQLTTVDPNKHNQDYRLALLMMIEKLKEAQKSESKVTFSQY